MSRTRQLAAFITVLPCAVALVIGASGGASRAHDAHVTFSAGEPGDPKKPSRTILVKAVERDDKTMAFDPARIEVRRGEQIRFVVDNNGMENHEFILATPAENRKHGEMMKKHPEMEHDDPNGKRVLSGEKRELIWKFSKRGEFEFACLIPGHYEAGMFGKVIVK